LGQNAKAMNVVHSFGTVVENVAKLRKSVVSAILLNALPWLLSNSMNVARDENLHGLSISFCFCLKRPSYLVWMLLIQTITKVRNIQSDRIDFLACFTVIENVK